MSLSTHVLDAALGRPAAGVHIALFRQAGEGWTPCADGRSDAEGRLRLVADGLEAGTHRLDFDTGAYFEASGQTGFYPQVSVTFDVTDPAVHHHVPLLLSPFAYSTYRGS